MLKPISEFVCREHRARLPVPAAGFEPAAFAHSTRRSYQLSYTGFVQRRRQESNLPLTGCSRPPGRPAPASSSSKSQRWDSNPHVPLYGSGARPVEHHWLHRSLSTLHSPLSTRSQGGRWESNPQKPVHSRVPQPLWVRPQYPRQESNLHDLRLRRAACVHHTPGKTINPGTPARNRTWTCSFGGSHDLRFTPAVSGGGTLPPVHQ